MTHRYTILDDHEGLDGGPRYEIDDFHGFTVCIVNDEETARLFCAAEKLLQALILMVDIFAPDHESDFAGLGMGHFLVARAAIAAVKGDTP